MAAAVDVCAPWHQVKKTRTRDRDDFMAVDRVNGLGKDITLPSSIDWEGAHGLVGFVHRGHAYLSRSADAHFGVYQIILGPGGIEAVTVCTLPRDGSFSAPIPLYEEGKTTLFVAYSPGFSTFLGQQSLHQWLVDNTRVPLTPEMIMTTLKSETTRYSDLACHRKKNNTPHISLFFFDHRSEYSFVMSHTAKSRSDFLKTMHTHFGGEAFTEIYQTVVAAPPPLTPSEEDERIEAVRRGEHLRLRDPHPVFAAQPFSLAAARASAEEAGCASGSEGTPTPSPPPPLPGEKECAGDTIFTAAVSLTIAALSLHRPLSREELPTVPDEGESPDGSCSSC